MTSAYSSFCKLQSDVCNANYVCWCVDQIAVCVVLIIHCLGRKNMFSLLPNRAIRANIKWHSTRCYSWHVSLYCWPCIVSYIAPPIQYTLYKTNMVRGDKGEGWRGNCWLSITSIQHTISDLFQGNQTIETPCIMMLSLFFAACDKWKKKNKILEMSFFVYHQHQQSWTRKS